MKFIENYQDGPWGALALSPRDRDELISRLQSKDGNIEIEDMFDSDSYKIERIRVVNDWKQFQVETEKRDPNVKWTTIAMRCIVIVVLGLALYGLYNVLF